MTAQILGVSFVLGGRGSDWFEAASHAAARLLPPANDAFPEESGRDAAITVVFQVAGEVFQPNFAGMRAGRLTKTDRGLVVEVAVPATADVPDPLAFIGRSLLEAVAFAKPVFARRNVSADFTRIQSIAQSAAVEMGVDPAIATDVHGFADR